LAPLLGFDLLVAVCCGSGLHAALSERGKGKEGKPMDIESLLGTT